MNIQGLHPKTVQSKVPFVEDILKVKNQLFIGLSETWLREHSDAEIDINGYTLFRSDRKRKKRSNRGRDSGGVACYIRNDLATSFDILSDFSNSVIESLCLFSRAENLIIILMYRQPDDSSHGNPSALPQFSEAINSIKKTLHSLNNPLPDIIMGGDFNLPGVDWELNDMTKGSTIKNMACIMSDMMNEFLLKQYVKQSTHKDGNILDLFFTNNETLVHDLQIDKPLNSITHHSIIEISTQFKPNVIQSNRNSSKMVTRSGFHSLNFFDEGINWEELNQAFSTYRWEYEFRYKTPDEMMTSFLEVCYTISKNYVPEKKSKKTSKVQKQRSNLARRRRRLNRLFNSAKSESRRNFLTKQLVTIEKLMMNLYRETADFNEKQAISNIEKNSKYFLATLKSFQR